ncbi:membrane protein [Microbacterium phage Zhengyi]|nr:membrane protein [Microbacterium phage Zhengyi]QYC53810.1 membrane protein [Microbacterium phage EugeneKrabs]
MSNTNPDIPTEVPNVVIEDPETRKRLNTGLSILLLILGLTAMFFGFFPEVAPEGDIIGRLEDFLTAAIALVSAWFGLGVTRRNYPQF